MRISFFRTYKPKQFTFIPRFYDERKEALEDREKAIKREMGLSTEEPGTYRPSISKGSLKNAFQYRRRANRASSWRLLIIMAILLVLVVYLIYFA